MLQQTQVKTVLPHYESWFAHFPDIASLANADEERVLKAWEGLGYYRRARLLHSAARLIVERFSGSFPAAFEEVMILPGIGRSTAGAIASFSFNTSTPVLDGNVRRVLGRWHGAPEATDKQLWLWAQQAIDASGDPATWNQAMMELGATCCSPRNPDCSACPVHRHCAAAFSTSESKPSKSPPVRDLHWRVDLHRCPQRGIWLTRRPASGIWSGLWTPPISELLEAPAEKATHIHLLTHRRLHLYAADIANTPAGEGQWFPDINAAALPTGIKRMLEKHQPPC